MKSVLYFTLGIILEFITIRVGLSAMIFLINLSIVYALISSLIAFGFGLLARKCFKKI